MAVTIKKTRRRGGCQYHSLGDRLARTWSRNPNFHHGRWCRYRQRLECRLLGAQSALRRYRAEAPRHAPFARPGEFERLGIWLNPRQVYLPRHDWALALELLRIVPLLPGYLRLWRQRCAAGLPQDRPIPVLAVLGAFFSSIGRGP